MNLNYICRDFTGRVMSDGDYFQLEYFLHCSHTKKICPTQLKKIILFLPIKSVHEGKPPGKTDFLYFPKNTVAIGSQFYHARNSEISCWKSEGWVDFQNVVKRYSYSI